MFKCSQKDSSRRLALPESAIKGEPSTTVEPWCAPLSCGWRWNVHLPHRRWPLQLFPEYETIGEATNNWWHAWSRPNISTCPACRKARVCGGRGCRSRTPSRWATPGSGNILSAHTKNIEMMQKTGDQHSIMRKSSNPLLGKKRLDLKSQFMNIFEKTPQNIFTMTISTMTSCVTSQADPPAQWRWPPPRTPRSQGTRGWRWVDRSSLQTEKFRVIHQHCVVNTHKHTHTQVRTHVHRHKHT